MNYFTNAAPAATATSKDGQEETDNDPANDPTELVQSFKTLITNVSFVVDDALQLVFCDILSHFQLLLVFLLLCFDYRKENHHEQRSEKNKP